MEQQKASSELTFDAYQQESMKTRTYYEGIDKFIDSLEIPDQANKLRLRKTLAFFYVTLGLVGEAGEIAEKMKKIIRDKGCEIGEQDKVLLKKELGDVEWYVTGAAEELDITHGEVAQHNMDKLKDRQTRGVLHGSGDNR